MKYMAFKQKRKTICVSSLLLKGKDITVVGWGAQLHVLMEACEMAKERVISQTFHCIHSQSNKFSFGKCLMNDSPFFTVQH
jgi:pyruvate/2-oxoglutarate/acetoin dehydrogenase E1 component